MCPFLMVPWISRQSVTVTFSGHILLYMFSGNPDIIKPLIFETKLCICYNKYLAIYVSVIIYTLKRVVFFAEAV